MKVENTQFDADGFSKLSAVQALLQGFGFIEEQDLGLEQSKRLTV
jgi:hypothetical protein